MKKRNKEDCLEDLFNEFDIHSSNEIDNYHDENKEKYFKELIINNKNNLEHFSCLKHFYNSENQLFYQIKLRFEKDNFENLIKIKKIGSIVEKINLFIDYFKEVNNLELNLLENKPQFNNNIKEKKKKTISDFIAKPKEKLEIDEDDIQGKENEKIPMTKRIHEKKEQQIKFIS